MPSPLKPLLDWLDHRTGYRFALTHLLDEPLPHGVGWFFTLGALLLMLLSVQAASGVVLMMYYVPSPDFAWDSVRMIMEKVQFGRVVRNLHAFGASAIVIVAALHLLRVFFFGSYKKPRELTWITGVVLLLVIMGFALTGYLLPWDQRAYWATVVTLNIAKSAPFAGEFAANLMRGGAELGALTLSRWYAAHVAVLPLALLALVAGHLVLMRRHQISGPITPTEGIAKPFFPYHAVRDVIVAGVVFSGVVALAIFSDAPLEPVADPSDASYVPRPEWYFLWLFQLLKYFPGKLEIVAAHGVPAVLVTLLLILPFIDRSGERRPWRRPIATVAALLIVGAIGVLTALGVRDVPPVDPEVQLWGAEALGGQVIAAQDTCVSCHKPGGVAAEWSRLRMRRDEAWITAHAYAPNQLVPDLPATADAIDVQRARAVAMWSRALRRGVAPPNLSEGDHHAVALIGANCLGCHVLDGSGHGKAPNLSRAGRRRDQAYLTQWIADPLSLEYDTDMPGFAERLSKPEIEAMAAYLAKRK